MDQSCCQWLGNTLKSPERVRSAFLLHRPFFLHGTVLVSVAQGEVVSKASGCTVDMIVSTSQRAVKAKGIEVQTTPERTRLHDERAPRCCPVVWLSSRHRM